MTCAQDKCTSPGTVPVRVSASNHKGEPCGHATVMMCEECALGYSADDMRGAAMMGDLGNG